MKKMSVALIMAALAGCCGLGSSSQVMKTSAVPVQVASASVDTDKDGVLDPKDECEGTPKGTKVDAAGCPETVKAVQDNWVLKGVQFETASDKIKPESAGTLDEVATILRTRTRVVVEIQGHTDNVGSVDENQSLSQRRADSVRQYLVVKGVPAGRMEAKGYGQNAPIADNATDAGRSQNRRIEFKVLKK